MILPSREVPVHVALLGRLSTQCSLVDSVGIVGVWRVRPWLLYIMQLVRTNSETSNFAPGVSPQNGAAAAPLFQRRATGARGFPTRHSALADLTESALLGDDFEGSAAGPLHPPAQAEDGDSDCPASRCVVFPTRR